MNGVAHANGQSPEKLASPLRKDEVATNGAGDANGDDDHSDEEDERAELEREVEHLVADRAYHDFVQHVVQHKEIADEDATTDRDFVVDQPEPVGLTGQEEADEDAEDSDSTLTDAEEYEDAHENPDQETKIPKEALEEAQKRFPNFWRFKHAMNTEYREGDYTEEQDPDYAPETDADAANLDDSQDEAATATAIADVSENSGNGALPDSTTADDECDWRQTEEVELASDQEKEDELEEEEDEDAMKAELSELKAEKEKDLKSDVDGLVEMVEYMTVVHTAEGAAAAPADDDAEGEDMEDEDVQGQTILELDVDGYASGEDPDFAVGEEVLDAASDSDINTDDEGGSGDKME